ncbi:hypothetical protein Pmani_028828 [Petrolisthes manimaculis]|uniref:CUB domain-containing protein n=1 Tax=Petrolisthes manimaculis TaxID=1843537 RepID=A0AAE1P0V1_9EUCA|nr:hypothetical protein Pmani_028828 [Petrolisthes manimaculis]
MYPQYTDDAICVWRLQAPTLATFTLDFIDFRLPTPALGGECSRGVLEVAGEVEGERDTTTTTTTTTLARMCGGASPSDPLSLRANTLILKFTSGVFYPRPPGDQGGFKLLVTAAAFEWGGRGLNRMEVVSLVLGLLLLLFVSAFVYGIVRRRRLTRRLNRQRKRMRERLANDSSSAIAALLASMRTLSHHYPEHQTQPVNLPWMEEGTRVGRSQAAGDVPYKNTENNNNISFAISGPVCKSDSHQHQHPPPTPPRPYLLGSSQLPHPSSASYITRPLPDTPHSLARKESPTYMELDQLHNSHLGTYIQLVPPPPQVHNRDDQHHHHNPQSPNSPSVCCTRETPTFSYRIDVWPSTSTPSLTTSNTKTTNNNDNNNTTVKTTPYITCNNNNNSSNNNNNLSLSVPTRKTSENSSIKSASQCNSTLSPSIMITPDHTSASKSVTHCNSTLCLPTLSVSSRGNSSSSIEENMSPLPYHTSGLGTQQNQQEVPSLLTTPTLRHLASKETSFSSYESVFTIESGGEGSEGLGRKCGCGAHHQSTRVGLSCSHPTLPHLSKSCGDVFLSNSPQHKKAMQDDLVRSEPSLPRGQQGLGMVGPLLRRVSQMFLVPLTSLPSTGQEKRKRRRRAEESGRASEGGGRSISEGGDRSISEGGDRSVSEGGGRNGGESEERSGEGGEKNTCKTPSTSTVIPSFKYSRLEDVYCNPATPMSCSSSGSSHHHHRHHHHHHNSPSPSTPAETSRDATGS